jgi:hypothetical protein
MATKAIQKKEWGAVKKPAPDLKKPDKVAAVDNTAPRLQRPPTNSTGGGGGMDTPVVKLMDFDVGKFQIVPELREGSVGDRFLEVKYDGNMIKIRFDDLPGFRRWPFTAGPAMKDGKPLGDSWSGAVDLSPEEYDHYASVEQHLADVLAPRAEELMLHTLTKNPKTGKPVVPYTEDQFRLGHFKSQLKPADPDKGYKANMRIGVQNEPFTKEGKPRAMPKIWLTKLLGPNQWTKPQPGTVHDLVKGCAICAVIRVVRGVYFGNTGWGMRYTLDEAWIFTNKSAGSVSAIDTSHMQEVDDPDDEPKAKPETQVRPFMNDTLPGYDDGTGNNNGAAALTYYDNDE